MSRALLLFSGGLDSILAACVLRKQGVDVQGLTFDSPFFHIDQAIKSAAHIDLPLRVVDFTDDIVALTKKPPHGFGKCMNPCIDCHALMLRRAGALMEKEKFDVLATGEVLNERPMSQTRRSLGLVAVDSGFERFILRPLSAQRLEPTEPEIKGLIDRTALLDLQGRSRRPQIALAKQFGVTQYPAPAGGCRLTEPQFSGRLRDMLQHIESPSKRHLHLLKYGRHIWMAAGRLLVVGRDEQDNTAIASLAEGSEAVIQADDKPGPTALLLGTTDEDIENTAAAICARYMGAKNRGCITMRITNNDASRFLKVEGG